MILEDAETCFEYPEYSTLISDVSVFPTEDGTYWCR